MKSLYEIVDGYSKYFGIDMLMQLLHRSDSAVRRILRKRQIKATKLHKIQFFKRNDVKYYLGECFK